MTESPRGGSGLSILLPVAFALVVLVLSLMFHPRLNGGGEFDAYLQIAEDLRAGHVRDDRFHPLLYPLLVAAVSHVTPSVFVAGKIVSALFFGLLIGAVQALLRRQLQPLAARLGTLAIALGPGLWLVGMQVATDMAGTALVVAGYALATAPGAGGVRRALAIGALAGAMVTTRYNLGLHAVILVALAAWRARSMRAVLVAALGAVIAAAPHAIVRYAAFGRVFGNENWKTIVLKYEFGRDIGAMQTHADAELAALLHEKWWGWLWQGVSDFGHWLGDGLPRLQLDAVHAVSPIVAATVLTLLAVAVLVGGRRSAQVRWLTLAALVHALSINVAFFALPRIMLPSTVLFAVVILGSLPRLAVPLALALGAQHTAGIPASWKVFRAAHAEAEIAAAREIVARHGALVQIAGSYPFLRREVDCAGTAMILGFGRRSSAADADAMWQRLDAVRREHAVSWFVIGRASNHALHGLCRRARILPGWERVRADDEVVVLRWSGVALELTVEPSRWQSGELLLLLAAVEFAAPPPWIGVVLRGPDDVEHRLQLLPQDGGHELRLPHGALAAGEWRAVPAVLLEGGRIEQGAAQTFVVE